MAGRTPRNGVVYHNVNVDMFSDTKIVRLRRKHKHEGVYVYLAMECAIYKNSYFLEWNDELADIFSETHHISHKKLKKIIDTCFELRLFDVNLYKKHKVLTSKNIQLGYLQIKVLSRKTSITSCLPIFFIKPKHFLLFGHEALKTNHFLKKFTKVDWENYIHTLMENDTIISTIKFKNEKEASVFHSSQKNSHFSEKNEPNSQIFATKKRKVK